jgi:6-phosphofructokinase 1
MQFLTQITDSCCSYLAVVAALASEADYVFIPEDPVKIDWKENLCQKLLQVEQNQDKILFGDAKKGQIEHLAMMRW